MRVYISVDIEGVAGLAHWDETFPSKSNYREFQEQMTAETVAACQAAIAAGADEIIVKDAHDNGRNIIAERLPESAKVKLIRGWSGHPLQMVEGLDDSFDALAMIGYHSGIDFDGSPVAHTMYTHLTHFTINDAPATEFMLHAYAAAMLNVPVVFVSGDKELCHHAKATAPDIHIVVTKEGIGGSIVSVHPKLAVTQIRAELQAALTASAAPRAIDLPETFHIDVGYKHAEKAFRASFYPGVVKARANHVRYETNDYFEALRAMLFIL